MKPLKLFSLACVLGCLALSPRGPNAAVFAQPPSAAELEKLQSRPLVGPKNLHFLGGWRVPPANIVKNDTYFSMAYTAGGLTGRRVGGELRLFIPHHVELGSPIHEFKVPREMGESRKAMAAWPELVVVKNHGDLYGPARVVFTPKEDGQYLTVYGLHWDQEGNRLWVSGRSRYAATGTHNPFLCSVDLSETPVKVSKAFTTNNDSGFAHVQMIGGGLVTIPRWFADAYLAGMSFGIGCGGYESGQGSSMGPTLCASHVPKDPDAPLKVKPLLGFQWNAPKEKREYRSPDYKPVNLSWAMPPDGARGYWFSGRIEGGPSWIDLPTFQGLCYFVWQATGAIDYKIQNDVFSTSAKNVVYVYDPRQLKEAALGRKQPDEVHGTYWNLDLKHKVVGNWFDAQTRRLFLLCSDAWRLEEEHCPAILVYEIR